MLCIAMGVFVAHLGVFMIIVHLNETPRPKPQEPNFKVRNEIYVDRSSGEKTVYREITVSTRLGTPAPGAPPAAKPALADSAPR